MDQSTDFHNETYQPAMIVGDNESTVHIQTLVSKEDCRKDSGIDCINRLARNLRLAF
jgi:hypothetical protein